MILPYRMKRICMMILAAVFILAPELPAADATLSDDQLMDDALADAKTELIQALKDRGYEDLADRLDGINPEKIGEFLGSAAGGDFKEAFNIAGGSAANYLNDKFQERLGEELKEMIQPNSPAAIIGKYIPWDSAQAKQIAISALREDWEGARNQLTAMVKSKGQENLEQLSKDIVTYGIDWVLEPAVGAGAGKLFISLVELQVDGIEWFKKWSGDYLSQEQRGQYNNLRKQGMKPIAAVEKIMEDSGFTALTSYPFDGTINTAAEYLEAQYAPSIGISKENIKETALNRVASEAKKIAEALSAVLNKEQEQYDRKIKQELLAIFVEVAKDNAELKQLFGGLKSARGKIDAINAETEKLETFWKKNARTFDTGKMEERKRDIEEQLSRLDQATRASGLERCGQIENWKKQISENLDDIDAMLERTAEIGKECREIVNKICGNRNDKSFVEKSMIALKKRFGLVGAQRREAATKKTEVVATLGKLEELKKKIQYLLEEQENISGALNRIEKWNDLMQAAQQNVDTPADTVDVLYTDICNIMDNPLFDRFKGKRESIRYTLLVDAAEAKKTFDGQKATVEAGLKKLKEVVSGFDGLRVKLDARKETLDREQGECRQLKDLDILPYESRIAQIDQKDNRYLEAYKKLNEQVTTCAGEAGPEISSSALDEAITWLNRARERGGIAIDNNFKADKVRFDLNEMAASAQNALSAVSASAVNAVDLITACTRAQEEGRQLLGEIQAATGASNAQMAILKQSYETAANAGKDACEKRDKAAAARDQQECRQAADQAMAMANSARQATIDAAAAANKMKSIYDNLKAKSELKSFDALLRKIPAVIQSIKDQIAGANDNLANVDIAGVGEMRLQAQNAATNANEAAQKVSDIVGIIRGLLAGIDPSLAAEARKIRKDAEEIYEIASRNGKQAADAAAEAGGTASKIPTLVADARTKIKELSALVERLGNCRNADLGGGLNDLRTNSDMGEVFSPRSGLKAEEAKTCAESAAEKCKSIKVECGPNERKDESGNCVSIDGYPRDDGEDENPFDEDFNAYLSRRAQRGGNRNRGQADRAALDQGRGDRRGGFTADDLTQDLDRVSENLSDKCKGIQCPPGSVCNRGACVERTPVQQPSQPVDQTPSTANPVQATPTPAPPVPATSTPPIPATPTPTPSLTPTPIPTPKPPAPPTPTPKPPGPPTPTPKPPAPATPSPTKPSAAPPANRTIEWGATQRCAEAEGTAYGQRWKVTLQQSGTQVTGNIYFHKCPGGGRAGYRLSGEVKSDGSFVVTGQKTESRGGLAGNTPQSQTWTLREGGTPNPVY